ncbi:MAG TPA: Sir2 family NAD-dependent protein deacetylase [Polyangiaceae bacterium]
MSLDEAVAELAALLGRARRVLAFTGAGISTRSNIPDFRGPNGVWRTRTPVEYPEFVQSEDARIEYWSWKLDGYVAFRDARPNPAHDALVTLERLGRLEAVVTQNVDGLHRAAGTSAERLIELHGTNAESECLGCARRAPIALALRSFETTRTPPRCSSCSGLLKPGVVMFGQSLDPEDMRRAGAAARNADFVMSLGSSLLVTPAADVPLVAVRRNVPYVIVNQGATPHDSIANLVIDGDVSEVLPAAMAALPS